MQENIRLRQRGNRDESEDFNFSSRDYENEPKSPKCLTKINKLPTLGGISAICTFAFLAYHAGTSLNFRYPKPLSLQDVSSYPSSFIAERAYNDLIKLIALGPRVAGTAVNNNDTVALLLNEISVIKQQANSFNNITVDVQQVSYDGFLKFGLVGMVTKFHDLKNVIVKFGPHNNERKFLINCHFDSVYTSPGASDNGINCANMIEVLRVLSKQPVTLKRDVIFLFNGAEETSMQGSYAFLKKHAWTKDIFAFINYDSCGAGGKDILFQANSQHPWLVEIYAKHVVHPYASVIAEELFNFGLVPSYTDYQNFRDIGNLPGLDFAHFTNGYVYHTKYDDINLIDRGVYQNTGDNMLSLVKAFANIDKISEVEKYDGKKLVYYDICGLFFFHYSQTTNVILNLALILLIVYNVIQNTLVITEGLKRVEVMRQFALSTAMPLVGIFFAVTSVVGVAMEVNFSDRTMSWFTNKFLLLPLYGFPVLIGLILPMLLLTAYKSNSLCWGKQVQLYMNGVLLLVAVLYMYFTVIGLRTSFIFFISLFLPAIVSTALGFFNLQRSVSLWTFIYLLSFIPHIINLVNMSARVLNLFIPLMGRYGTQMNPDLFVGSLFGVVFIFLTIFLVPSVIMIAKPFLIIGALAVLHILAMGAIMFTPLGFPFNDNPLSPTPQRFVIIHTNQEFYDMNSISDIRKNGSGYWIISHDRRSLWTLEDHISRLKSGNFSTIRKCDKEFLCGLPFLASSYIQLGKSSHWFDSEPPALKEKTVSLDLLSKNVLNEYTVRYNFNISCSDRASIIIAPTADYKVSGWSFNTDGLKKAFLIDNREVYFIYYQSGASWQFWIDLETSNYTRKGSAFSIALSGHFQDGSQPFSDSFKRFIAQFPSWAHVAAWPAIFKSYEFSF